MTEALNPEPLLRALHEAGVRHIIIGGFAVNAHGRSRDCNPRLGGSQAMVSSASPR